MNTTQDELLKDLGELSREVYARTVGEWAQREPHPTIMFYLAVAMAEVLYAIETHTL